MSKAFKRLKDAEIMRQMALDYINDHPGEISKTIVGRLGWSAGSGASRLYQMVVECELRREPFELVYKNEKGLTIRQKTFSYFALVKTTKRADDVFKTIGSNLTKAGRERHKKENPGTANQWVNGCWKNSPDNKPMYTNQGGQGASKPRMATYLEAMA